MSGGVELAAVVEAMHEDVDLCTSKRASLRMPLLPLRFGLRVPSTVFGLVTDIQRITPDPCTQPPPQSKEGKLFSNLCAH